MANIGKPVRRVRIEPERDPKQPQAPKPERKPSKPTREKTRP